ncbi:MAG TPA: amidohydrolase [Candidatus Limnocylindria bacterium]|nr:amidohydrolase [Candidatus Limnocylindria bacterium]
MDGARRVLKDGAILVRGRTIEAVGFRPDVEAAAPGAERRVLERHVLLPGFVDCHLHASQALARGVADDIDEVTVRWGWDRIFPWEAALEDEEIYVGGLLTAVELIRSGVTCFADPGGFRMDPIARAVAETGIRAVLTVGGMDTWSAGFPLPPSMIHDDPTTWALEASERLIADWHGREHGRVRGGYSIRVLMNASEPFVVEIGRRARERNLTVQLHLAVSPDRVQWVMEKTGRRPVEYLQHLGVLGPNWVLAHLGWAHESEIPILTALDAKVCHSPASSMHNARGAVRHGKIPEMAAAGVSLCLGADAAACNNSVDMFRTMYLTCVAHNETRLQLGLFPPERVLEMATLGGARALAWEDEIGSLQPGKRADVIGIDLHRAGLSPTHDASLIPNLVYAGSAADVTFAMVDGRVLMDNRVIAFLDEHALVARAQRCGERMLSRMPYRLQPRWPFLEHSGRHGRAERNARC